MQSTGLSLRRILLEGLYDGGSQSLVPGRASPCFPDADGMILLSVIIATGFPSV